MPDQSIPHPIPVPSVEAIDFPALPLMPEAGDRPSGDLARLNLNEAPMSPSPLALAAAQVALADSHRYPDHHAVALAGTIAARTSIAADRIVFGNGSGELLVQCAQVSLDRGDEAVMPDPTFPTCGKGVQMTGAHIVKVPLRPDGANDVAAMLSAITPRTRLFYLCTPNNPTGNILGEADLERAIREVPATCLLVIDEAYFEFACGGDEPDTLTLLRSRTGPWVVTRTFSKAYCMAGLRVGYALCSDEGLKRGFSRIRHNFNVSRPSLAAARAAFEDAAYMRAAVAETVARREQLRAGLERLGFAVLPSFANFLTVRFNGSAAALAQALHGQGIAVQALGWPDANGSLRITIGAAEENERVLAAIENQLEAA
ncbi:aminotransferase class I/II-fold pyridoxal phosphate-dependent enzyme [Sagittula sp. NFXS13]|uniref:pyridoxal phosphate-dependent aminotransferase n=1 Tax=Sagittula sp. NFXS13 TaxID=2819095 RepID=UPI0032DEE956